MRGAEPLFPQLNALTLLAAPLLHKPRRRMRQLRAARGLSLRALGALAEVPFTSMHAGEMGQRAGTGLPAATCGRLAKALGISVDALVSMDEDDLAPSVVQAVVEEEQ